MEMEEIEDENRVCEKNSDPTSFSPRDTGRFLNVKSDADWYESKDMISDELTRFDPSGDTFIPLVD